MSRLQAPRAWREAPYPVRIIAVTAVVAVTLITIGALIGLGFFVNSLVSG